MDMNGDARARKIISFTNEYKEELTKLNNEKNSSNLICRLLREHYKGGYAMKNLGEDMQHIKEVLESILEGLNKEA